MFKILSSKTTKGLEQEAAQYNISLLGSLTISNGHHYLAIIGELKEVPKIIPREPEETKVTSAPSKRSKRKPKAT